MDTLTDRWGAPRATFVIVDVETTGSVSDPASPACADVAQVAAVRLGPDLTEQARFSSFTRPLRPANAHPAAMRVHGISMERLLRAPHPRECASGLLELLDGADCVVAHNGAFDRRFLRLLFHDAGLRAPLHPLLCTQRMAARLVRLGMLRGTGGRTSLDALSIHLGLGPRPREHDALDDARRAAHVLRHLLHLDQKAAA